MAKNNIEWVKKEFDTSGVGWRTAKPTNDTQRLMLSQDETWRDRELKKQHDWINRPLYKLLQGCPSVDFKRFYNIPPGTSVKND